MILIGSWVDPHELVLPSLPLVFAVGEEKAWFQINAQCGQQHKKRLISWDQTVSWRPNLCRSSNPVSLSFKLNFFHSSSCGWSSPGEPILLKNLNMRILSSKEMCVNTIELPYNFGLDKTVSNFLLMSICPICSSAWAWVDFERDER